MVYESLNLKLTTSIKKLVADLLHPKNDFITIKYIKV